jgi:hypothetical protein
MSKHTLQSPTLESWSFDLSPKTSQRLLLFEAPRPIRFRLVLPLVFGFLAAALMTWDYENNLMSGLMGMGWDMGPPFRPYQAIYLLLFRINAPAFVLSMPILKLLNLQTLSLQYGVLSLAIVGWWCWIGTLIDFGILCRRSFRNAKMIAGFSPQ